MWEWYKSIAQCRSLVGLELLALTLLHFYMKWLHIYQTVGVDALYPERCKLSAYTRLCNQCAKQTHVETLDLTHTLDSVWQENLLNLKKNVSILLGGLLMCKRVCYGWIIAGWMSHPDQVIHSQWTYLMYIHLYTQKFSKSLLKWYNHSPKVCLKWHTTHTACKSVQHTVLLFYYYFLNYF